MQIFNLYTNFATTLEYGSPIAKCIYGCQMDDKHRLIDGEAMLLGEKSAEIVDESTKVVGELGGCCQKEVIARKK